MISTRFKFPIKIKYNIKLVSRNSMLIHFLELNDFDSKDVIVFITYVLKVFEESKQMHGMNQRSKHKLTEPTNISQRTHLYVSYLHCSTVFLHLGNSPSRTSKNPPSSQKNQIYGMMYFANHAMKRRRSKRMKLCLN